MDLISGKLLWRDTLPNAPVYPVLTEDIQCDVLVIGGGEAGSLCSYLLSKHNLNTVLIEKRTIGGGSSSVNTGLLQYANDKSLTSCIHAFGEASGVRFYQLCRQAVDQLERFSSELEFSCDFVRRSCLYTATEPVDVPAMKKEYELLKKYGFPVEYWEPQQIESFYSFRKPGAIYSKEDAEVNPYKLTNALTLTASLRGVRVYQQTEIISHTAEKDHLVFYTKDRRKIIAAKAIFATGYETQQLKPNPNAVLESSYAIATQPVVSFPGWHERSLIWETARPYLFIRTTADNRIIIGGMDEPTRIPEERDARLPHKKKLLLEEIHKLFPHIGGLQAEYYWTGMYASTHDGLPLIGEQEGFPHCYFALGYGGNGTVYSTIAADIIVSLLMKGTHPSATLFRFDRPKREMKIPVGGK